MARAKRKPEPSTVREPKWRPTNMRHWRKDSRLSLEQVGEALGVTHATIQRWEVGKVEPGASALERLAQLYKTDIHSMLNRFPQVPRHNGTEETESMSDIWDKADPATRRQIVKVARTLLD